MVDSSCNGDSEDENCVKTDGGMHGNKRKMADVDSSCNGDSEKENVPTDGCIEKCESREAEMNFGTDEDSGEIKNKNGSVNGGNEMFFVGQRLCSIKELETVKKAYEDNHHCELWKRDVRTLATAKKRVPKRVAIANQDLIYYSLKLSCKFGGRAVKTRAEKRKRKTKSFRQGLSVPYIYHFVYRWTAS